MRVQVKEQLSLEKYKGQFIRRVVDVFGNELVFVNMPYADYENAPMFMKPEDFYYASVADAKRAIRGEKMKYVIPDIYEYWGEKYMNRFKKIAEVSFEIEHFKNEDKYILRIKEDEKTILAPRWSYFSDAWDEIPAYITEYADKGQEQFKVNIKI